MKNSIYTPHNENIYQPAFKLHNKRLSVKLLPIYTKQRYLSILHKNSLDPPPLKIKKKKEHEMNDHKAFKKCK